MSLAQRLRHLHPALILMALDAFGLVVATYLSSVELQGKLPYCGPLAGCEEVALSEYARIGGPNGVPVAIFGIGLSVTLFAFALVWYRTGTTWALATHYGLSLVGVLFEGWFQFAQIFLIGAICVWCESYGISLILRFVIALWVYLHTPNPDAALPNNRA